MGGLTHDLRFQVVDLELSFAFVIVIPAPILETCLAMIGWSALCGSNNERNPVIETFMGAVHSSMCNK